MRARVILLGLTCLLPCMAETAAPLVVEAKIPMPGVKGRIDHLALNVSQQQLYVAALGNNTVEVIDLVARKHSRSVEGFDEPQGIAFMPRMQVLYVANGGDGSVHVLPQKNRISTQLIKLGDDADNVRIDLDQQLIYVGHGSGALAVIDPMTSRKIADIPLKAHPESFQIESAGPRIFVNVPDAHEIAIVDRAARKQIASWPTGDLHANFAMALDERSQQLLVAFRRPAMLAAFSLSDGKKLAQVPTCGDTDDVFVDAKRSLVYLSCGEGFVDVLETNGPTYTRVGRLQTVPGARTALFSRELDRLFLAAPAHESEPAAIWVLQPVEWRQ